MKKLIALLLALSMVFMFASCNNEDDGGDTTCTSHVDSDNNGKCDNCGADVTPTCTSHTDANSDGKCDTCGADVQTTPPSTEGLKLSEAIIAQIDAASSAKAQVIINLTAEGDGWRLDSDDNVIESDSYTRGYAIVDIVISKTEDGINAKITFSEKSIDDKTADFDAETLSTSDIYLVDGYIYEYNAQFDAYMQRPATAVNVSSMTGMLEAIVSDVELTADEKNAILGGIGDMLIDLFGIQNSAGALDINLKDSINDLADYIAALNPETTKVRTVLNDALALVDEELTVEAIITKLSELCDLTALEAYDALDAWLDEEYGTRIQSIYNQIINDPRLVVINENLVKAQGGDDDDVADALEALNAAKAYVLRDMLADALTRAEITDATLYEIVYTLVAPKSETAPNPENNQNGGGAATQSETEDAISPTKDEFIAYLNNILDASVEEFCGELLGMPAAFLEQVKTIANGVTVNKLELNTDLVFTGTFNLSTLTSVFGADVTVVLPYDSTHNSTYSVKMDVEFKLYDISNTAVSITAPTGKAVYYDIYSVLDNMENVYIRTTVTMPGQPPVIQGYFEIETMYDSVKIPFAVAYPTQPTDRIELALDYEYYSGSQYLWYAEGNNKVTVHVSGNDMWWNNPTIATSAPEAVMMREMFGLTLADNIENIHIEKDGFGEIWFKGTNDGDILYAQFNWQDDVLDNNFMCYMFKVELVGGQGAIDPTEVYTGDFFLVEIDSNDVITVTEFPEKK